MNLVHLKRRNFFGMYVAGRTFNDQGNEQWARLGRDQNGIAKADQGSERGAGVI